MVYVNCHIFRLLLPNKSWIDHRLRTQPSVLSMQDSLRQKEERIEELEEALRESVQITAEREVVLAQEEHARTHAEKQVMSLQVAHTLTRNCMCKESKEVLPPGKCVTHTQSSTLPQTQSLFFVCFVAFRCIKKMYRVKHL